MTNLVPSMSDLLPACIKVLDTELKPIHYRELTAKALRSIDVDVTRISMFRAIEDVREKLPDSKKYDVFYTGAPDCLMARRQWFKHNQLPLFNNTADVSIRISGSASAGITGAFEALMRDEFMLDKFNGNKERRCKGRARGLVVEHHVAQWFQRTWPEFYLPPDNHGVWDKPCSHDFKLKVGGAIILVDVAGQNANGSFGKPQKRATSLHLLCSVSGDDVIWEAVTRGEHYNESTTPETSLSPANMIVWLNCVNAGIDHVALRRTVGGSVSMAAD